MSNQNFENNSVNGTKSLGEGSSPGRYFLVQQQEICRHQVTRMQRNQEANKVMTECFYRSKPFDEEGKHVRGYKQRMFRIWRDEDCMFESTEQHVCEQARAIRKNG